MEYYTTSTLVYKISRLLNIENLNFKNLCIFIYKVQNKLLKSEINLVLNSDIHTHNTRLANKIHIDHSRTNLAKFSILSKATHLYNSLPKQIKIVTFSVEIKKI
jgi:hypothetical protein